MRSNPSLVLILAIAAAGTCSAATPQQSATTTAIAELSDATGATTSVNPATGLVRHAEIAPGRTVAGAPTRQDKAELFLLRHGRAFGIDSPSLDLQLRLDRVDNLGRAHIVYDQVHRGVPVFGGRLGLHFDADGELVTANGTIVPGVDTVPTQPEIGAERARELARSVVGKLHDLDPTVLETTAGELVVFNDGVIWGRSGDVHLAWVLEVSDTAHSVNEQLAIDAVDGQVIERIDLVEEIHRIIYEHDASNKVWEEGDELPYSGSGSFRDEEINNLITVAEQTHTTFSMISGGAFLSWNGTDGSMRSFYDRTGMDCPNAYFDGSSTSFCVGTATDDVIAHEWTHGYTSSTHGLIYQWQSGALNEAYSDIFGETVDLLYDSGSDNPSTVRESEACSEATNLQEPELVVNSPAAIAGPMEVRSATFNPSPPWNVSGTIELADDGTGLTNDACDPLVDFTPGRIALITMAGCSERFLTPVANAEAAGAIAAIVVNPLNDNLVDMTGDGRLGIPAVFLGRSDGDNIREYLEQGVEVTMRAGGDGSLRWLIGEDSSAFGGAIRDMWNPECLGDPGRVFSGNYYCSSNDNGGVHTNSGVANHAYALLVDGATFNGVEIPAIGLTRAAHIYWRAMTVYQMPLSDLRDHADALASSCTDLVGAPLADLVTGEVAADVVTAATCAAVDAAMAATEMRTWPTHCHFGTILDPGPPLQPATIQVFSESFDSQPAGWTLSNEGVFDEYEPRDWAWTENVPDGGDGGAFYAIDSPLIGNCVAGDDDQSGVMHLDSPAIELPLGARPVVLFDHYVATEKRVDGGNLKISVNGAKFEIVPSEAFLFNPYNDVLRLPEWNDNPLAGEEAFVGTDDTTYRGSWGQSQVNLGGMVSGGDTIVLRFDFGTDGCAGQDGWYVDNVRVVMEPRDRSSAGRVTP